MALALLLAAGAAGAAKAGQIELISKADPLPGSTGTGFASALSADGRWVVFESDAPNLIPGQADANGFYDVFLRDRVAGTTTLISHQAGKPATASPAVGDWSSLDAGISADGRYVSYVSLGTRLVPGQNDANDATDVFLYDRVTGANTLISHAQGDPSTTADGISGGAAISADGNSVVFWSIAGNLVAGQTSTSVPAGLRTANVFLYNRSTGSITLLSHASGSPAATANRTSAGAVLSADGGYVAFWSDATNLLPGANDTGTFTDVFLWERATGKLSLVSHASGATTTPGSGFSVDPQISSDGRWIAFRGQARNLVAGQTASPGAATENVFLFDRVSGQTRLVSHASASPLVAVGAADPDFSGGFSLSADGRWIAFTSAAPDLVAGQVNLATGTNVFLYDRTVDRNTLVSHNRDSQTTSPAHPASRQPRVSADGRYVAYESASVDLVPHQTDTPDGYDVFLYDRTARTSVLASHLRSSLTTAANGPSQFARISADGGTVVFDSYATDLAGGQVDLQGFQDVFLYDRKSAEVTPLTAPAPELPAVTPVGPSSAAGISADGRYVAFQSRATGLVPGQVDEPYGFDPFGNRTGTWDVFLRDRATGKTTLLSRSKASPPTANGGSWPALSADGGFVAFVLGGSDSGKPFSVQLYDRAADRLTLVNHALGSASTVSGFAQFPPAISADGRWVAYDCFGCELVAGQQSDGGSTQAYLYDRLTGANALASHGASAPTATGDGGSRTVALSADGRYVLFESTAANLVAGQSRSDFANLFVFDRTTGAVKLVSHTAASATTPIDAFTSNEVISADGRWIAFSSIAPNLVPGATDGNGRNDVFLYDQTTGALTLVSHAAGSPTAAAAGESWDGSLSADGRWLVFSSRAADLLPGLAGDVNNVFLYDRDTGTNSLVSSAPGAPGTPVTGGADSPSISADGSCIAFLSPAGPDRPGQPGPSDFVSLYVQERATGARALVGRLHVFSLFGYDGHLSFFPLLSANGLQVAFTSDTGLVPGDLNATWDAYLYDAAGGPVTVPPCVLLDATLRSGSRQALTAAGTCGVPAGAKQVVLKLTVSQGTGQGNVQVYPGNAGAPSAGILRFSRGASRSAVLTVPLGNGAVALLPFVNGNGTVRVGVEVDGYVP
jgi:Tol biopolymer transport system component